MERSVSSRDNNSGVSLQASLNESEKTRRQQKSTAETETLERGEVSEKEPRTAALIESLKQLHIKRPDGLILRPQSAAMDNVKLMKFCSECRNLMCPQEDWKKKTLFDVCRNCLHREVADNNCVDRQEVHRSADERIQIFQDMASDPTLPRIKSTQCAKCKHGEAVFCHDKSRGEEEMTLLFKCCNPKCDHGWTN